MPASTDPLEIRALVKIMDELDYYQILGVEPSATMREIRRAFHDSSRSFHPDATRELEADLRRDCGRISRRITEAYCVLRDSRRRQAYDARIQEGAALRIQLTEARQAHSDQTRAERRGRTPQGRQFHARAEADLKRGNLAGAIQNIQMALTFEGRNDGFQQLLDELRQRQKAAR